jgi:hypothetical protein
MVAHRSIQQPGDGLSPLDMVASTFTALTEEPRPLEMSTRGMGLPTSHVRLADLQDWLNEAAPACHARNAAWRTLVELARSGDPAWVVGAVGVALPRLKKIAVWLADGCAGDRVEMEAAVLAGFASAFGSVSLDREHLEQALLWAAFRAGAWRVWASAVHGRPEPGSCQWHRPRERLGPRFRVVLPEEGSLAQLLGG